MKQVEEQKIVCEKIETKFKGEKKELTDEICSLKEELKVKENSFKNE